jgi:hypothetical protein
MLLACGAATLGLVVATSGDAASIGRTNHLTFSGTVALPGVVLARGVYTFEAMPDHPAIVRVLSRDRSVLYFTGFTGRVTRPLGLRAGRPVTFAETPRGAAPRISVWYPDGQQAGYQFLYADARR